MRAYLATDDRWRLPVALDKVSPWLVKATLAVEDKRFRSHRGVDIRAIARALSGNAWRGRTVSGASTITMQVAGFADRDTNRPAARRGWGGKLVQGFRALQIERTMTKDRILELYLTHAPYGGNIHGAEAASRRYFGKPAADLTLSEAALLAGIPQSPTRLRPDRRSDAAAARRAHVLRRMAGEGLISPDDLTRTLALKPAARTLDSPVRAPHFCDMVRARHEHAVTLRTSLDLPTQDRLETVLAARVKALRPRGVGNAAGVVIDNATGEVRAMVGSVDYNAAADNGQVNAAAAPRSPGSTLKPFLYALAYDRGALSPATVLADVPMAFADYVPENFDRTFQGPVTADRALAYSLNVPAIDTLRRVGVTEALAMLRGLGVADTLRGKSSDYGLSLAIGTCSMKLVDLASAYATLARGGLRRPWRLLPAETSATMNVDDGPASAPLSAAACYLALRALADPALRPPEAIDPSLMGLEGVAWKTGTSSGFRDAWTFACDRRHTVGVWVGNMDGRASRALVGGEAAAPVALGMVKWLRDTTVETRSDRDWPARPAAVSGSSIIASAPVCAATGLSPNGDCPVMASADVPPGAPRLSACEVHRAIQVDLATSGALCTRCLSGRPRARAVVAQWPVAVAGWTATQTGRPPPDAPPPHFAGCETRSAYAAPRIASPKPGEKFEATDELPAAYQRLALRAVAAPAGLRLFWFVDGALAGVAEAGGEPAFTGLKPGRHKLRVVDEHGRSDSSEYVVGGD